MASILRQPGKPSLECQTMLDVAATTDDGGGSGDTAKPQSNEHQ